MTHLQVAEGIKYQRVNKFQALAKARADGYTPAVLELLGIFIMEFPTHPTIEPAVTDLTIHSKDWILDRSTRQEPSARSLIASEAQDTTVGRPVKKPRKPTTRALASQLPPHAEPREDPTHADEPAEVDEGLLGFDAGGLTNQHGCPSMPPPLPANNLYLTEDEIKRHLSNLLASLFNALKLTNNILKDSCERILTHITYKCPKASKPRYVSFPGISVVQCLPRDEVDKLTSQLQEAGVKWLKTAEGLLAHKDHKDDCLANCTVEDLEQLRTDGWEILGSVENMLPQKDLRKQIR
ncbi:hypothetical protein PtA15_4A69 [Puccinia triticina]|uniref:Uncharacterized protein n=1 Tax=Puccinia triticina TaxID=208348 RepID=A0ABY7CHL7_9BASI|nr:uncharacterized protein PtA15_4A69 [Puccinia triticina]WAQ83621.1 hypothetical protein PtA15_4A69 [Puccinia triticina]